jgi:hypothetical protein
MGTVTICTALFAVEDVKIITRHPYIKPFILYQFEGSHTMTEYDCILLGSTPSTGPTAIVVSYFSSTAHDTSICCDSQNPSRMWVTFGLLNDFRLRLHLVCEGRGQST